MKTIEIGPKEVNYHDGSIFAEFSDRTYIFKPDEEFSDKGNIQECANYFVCGIMMLSYIDQIKDALSEYGYDGEVTLKMK